MKYENVNTHHDKKINDTLAKKYACYVLLTCGEPQDGGEMQVEMSYHGNTTLAAYLLQGAQTYMDDKYELTDDE